MHTTPSDASRGRARDDLRHVRIGSDPALEAILGIPDHAKSLVILAHGRGSGRLSPRNNYVAARLRQAGIATLLLDLLSPESASAMRIG